MYNPQHNLLTYLKSKNIVPQAYSPLGSTNAPLLTDEVVAEISAKHNLKPVHVLLGYLRTPIHVPFVLHCSLMEPTAVAKGIVVLSKSTNPDRITANFKGALTGAITLEKSDIERLDGLAASGKQKRYALF